MHSAPLWPAVVARVLNVAAAVFNFAATLATKRRR